MIGIQLDKSCLRWVSLLKKGEKVVIDVCETIKLDLPEVDAQAIIASKCGKNNFESVTGIEGKDLLIRKLKTELKSKRVIQKALPFQLETLIPYSLDDLSLLPFYRKDEIRFFALPKTLLQKHLGLFQHYGIDPEWVSSHANALMRFAQLIAPQKVSYLIVHVGLEHTTLVSVIEGGINGCVTVHLGAADLEQEQFQKEVDRAICFLFKERSVSDFLLTGHADEISFLSEWSSIECESYQGIDFSRLKQYAIPIGLGLDVLKQDSQSVQFRQGKLMHRRQCASIKRKVFVGATLCLMFAGLGFFQTERLLEAHRDRLENEVVLFAKEHKRDIPKLDAGALWQQKDLQGKLTLLKKKVSSKIDRAGYYKTSPRVSDLLVFLSTHPMLKEGIEIKGIRYSLEKYPKIQSPRDPYLVKVHLDFESADQTVAKEFYESLLVDSKLTDIKWNREQNGYHATFFIQQ